MTGPIDIFEVAGRVLAADVAKAHHAKLFPRGNYHRGECPLCGAGSSGGDPFQAECVTDAKGGGRLFYCHSCEVGGDAITLEVLLGGHVDTIEDDARGNPRNVPARVIAARVLAKVVERVAREPVRHARRERPAAKMVDSGEVAQFIMRTAVPAAGSIVEEWLRYRGLNPHGIPGALDVLRFHPRCPVVPWRIGADPSTAWLHAPAMIAPLERITGPAFARMRELVGVHVTYLRADGRGKADLPAFGDGKKQSARKMWGETKGAACWLTDPDQGQGMADAAPPLIVGEGLETTWSEAERRAGARATAVLSLHNLQGSLIRDRYGAIPLWSIRGDPQKPPLTIEDAGDVIVLVDADMSELKPVLVQQSRLAPRVKLPITPLQRSKICAALATDAWRRAGADSVRAIRPPMGMDFNDFRGK